MDVEVKPVAASTLVDRTVYRLSDEEGARRFLREPTLLRMLHIGRRGTMALLWTPSASSSSSSSGGGHSLWWYADVLSISQPAEAPDAASEWFAWPVPGSLDARAIPLRSANDFTPLPPLVVAPVAFRYTNFEVFCFLPQLQPRTLLLLCQRLASLFSSVRGRCELRYDDATGRLCLDFGCLAASQSFRPVFQTLSDVLGRGTLMRCTGARWCRPIRWVDVTAGTTMTGCKIPKHVDRVCM